MLTLLCNVKAVLMFCRLHLLAYVSIYKHEYIDSAYLDTRYLYILYLP